MRKLLFLISAGVVCFYSCKTASDRKSNSVKDEKDSLSIVSKVSNDSPKAKQDLSKDTLPKKEIKTEKHHSERKSGDTSKIEKKIIPKHNSPDQQEIDSIKKAKGKKKFNKE
jgi:hypothetical protein